MSDIIIESDTHEFIDKLPTLTLEPLIVHLIMVAIRSRKARLILNIKLKDLLVERKIIRPLGNVTRERYFNAVYNYALLQHGGRYNFKEISVPKEVMAIYATLSPRDVKFAVADLMRENIQMMFQNDRSAMMQLAKQGSRFFGALHRHRAKGTHFITVDIDVLDKKLFKKVKDIVSPLPVWMITETSRGYHFILDLSRGDDAKAFHEDTGICHALRIKYAKKGLEIQRDSQEPVPGTFYCREDGSKHFVKIL